MQVFDATNTTRERRAIIISFAKEKGYKVSVNEDVLAFPCSCRESNKKVLKYLFVSFENGLA